LKTLPSRDGWSGAENVNGHVSSSRPGIATSYWLLVLLGRICTGFSLLETTQPVSPNLRWNKSIHSFSLQDNYDKTPFYLHFSIVLTYLLTVLCDESFTVTDRDGVTVVVLFREPTLSFVEGIRISPISNTRFFLYYYCYISFYDERCALHTAVDSTHSLTHLDLTRLNSTHQ